MKISQLIALLGADAADNDLLTIVDTSATATKKITVAEARIALVTSARIIAALGYTPEADGQGVTRSATVTLTAADLAVLDTVPFELVAAPGVGKVLVPASGGASALLSQLNGGIGLQNETGTIGAYFNGSPPTFPFSEPFNLSELYIWIAGVDQVAFSQSAVGSKGAPLSVAENGSVVLVAGDTLLVPGAIATSAIGAAGTGYVALETVTRGNATIRIDTVGGGGEVLTYTVTVAGTNNIVGTAQATTGGSGANFTVDINTVNVSVNPMTLTVKTLYSVMDVA